MLILWTERRLAWLFIFLLSASIVACTNDADLLLNEKRTQNENDIRAYLSARGITAQRADNGLFYRIVSTGGSRQEIAIGHEIQLNYRLTRLDGFGVDSSDAGVPTVAVFGLPNFGLSYLSEETQAFLFRTLLREGDSANLFVPSHLGLGAAGSLALPAYSPFRMDVRVLSIRSEEQQMDFFERQFGARTSERSESGLRFGKVTSIPTAVQVDNLSSYNVRYVGRTMDNKVFDSGTITVSMGSTSLVKGFTEGLLKMRVGETAHLLFPSALGYGVQGSRNSIRGYAPLFFEVEVLQKL